MSRRLARSAAVLVTGVALLAVSAPARPAGSTGAAAEVRKGGTLRYSLGADVDFVDPALAYFARSWPIGYATCAKLFNYPDAPGAAGTRLIPEVVDRTTRSSDQRTYTFELKQTFRFHTGAPVTARSFALAFNRDANPKLGSPATAYMHEIVGADAVIAGNATSISGIRVLGRYRLQIQLTQPLGDFTARLTIPFFCPILPTTPIDRAVNDPPGSGPYYIAERIVNQRIVLERNRYYRGDRPANVDRIVWTVDPHEACLLAAEQDRIDHCFFGGLGGSSRDLAEKYGINRPDGRFFVRPGSLATWYIAFNHDRPAFKGADQIPLKKAINYAIDRREIVHANGHLASKRADQMLPPALTRAEKIYPLAGSDYATARRLLARARFQPTELVLYTNNSPSAVAQAHILEFNFEQIGIDLDVKYFDISELDTKATTPGEPFDLIHHAWAADYADPAGFFIPLLAHGAGRGGVNLDDPRVNARIEAANRLTGEARRKAWADLDVDLMRDNPPWVPLYHPNSRSFVSRSVDCVLHQPVYGFDLAAVCKK
jgi:ABC-type oligopeptide transport system substrate-binding subunit